MSLWPWLVILCLIVINALYVAAEFAAVSVRHSQIRQLAQEGSSLARRLWPVLQDTHSLDRYIAACQIGITLSSLILGAFGQATIARELHVLLQASAGMAEVAAQTTAALAVLVLLTVLQVVFGELVPKSLALQFPTQLSLYTYWPMRWSLALFFGFIAILNGSGLLILRLLRVGGAGGHRHIHSPEEIQMLIAESRDGGLLEPEEQVRLHHALHLGRHTVRQLMVPRRQVQMLSVDTPLEEVFGIAIESPYSRLPVYRDGVDNVLGMLHSKDIAARYADDETSFEAGQSGSVEEILRPLTSVPSSITIDRLIRIFRERRCRMALVLDEFGGVEGIITLEDILTELVGEVGDEFKHGQVASELLDDGRVRLPAMLLLDEASQWFQANWQGDEEEVDTLGGLVLHRLGRMPVEGERLTIDGTELQIEQMDGPAIRSLLITPKPDAQPGATNAPVSAEPAEGNGGKQS